MFDRGALILLSAALLVSACNLRRPEVTLTLAPIDTRTPAVTEAPDAPTVTSVASASPTLTLTITTTRFLTLTSTSTATSTEEPSQTASATQTQAATPTPSVSPTSSTPSATATPTVTSTDTPPATSTGTATVALAPSLTATATAAGTATAAASSSPTPTEAALPTLTETPAPTNTRAATATSAPTRTEAPAPTDTETTLPSATDAPTATATVASTASPTESPLPTATATETGEPSPTPFLPDPAADTPTMTPSEALTQSLLQEADDDAPTATSAALIRAVPSIGPRPTLDEAEIARLLATPEPRPTRTATAAPTDVIQTLPPTGAQGVAILAEQESRADAGPGDERALASTPPASRSESQTIPPSPTPLQPTVAVRRDLLQPVIEPIVPERAPFTISSASVFEFNVGEGQVFNVEDIQLRDGVRLFLPNPVDAASFLRTDVKGVLRYKPLGAAQEAEMGYSPYFANSFNAIDRIEQNKNRIAEMDWSADGRLFSFRIDPPQGTDNTFAGVWFWHPQASAAQQTNFAVIYDCAAEGHNSCRQADRRGPVWFWKTLSVEWSPVPGSNSLLLTLQLPQEGRNALAMREAITNRDYGRNVPRFVRYDYGSWNLDGHGITVSGRRPDGLVIIGAVDNNLQGEHVVLNGSALGLWLRDAVLLPSGQYVALGRPGPPGSGPVALYNQAGQQISPFVGNAAPEEVHWFPDRSAVVVTVEGRQYTVPVAGGDPVDVTDATFNPQFSAPQSEETSQIPDAVISGAEYYPAQQLRVAIPFLNVRAEPTINSDIAVRLQAGDYVAIFAGPYESEGYPWWRIQTAYEVFGWIAAEIDGAPSVRPI